MPDQKKKKDIMAFNSLPIELNQEIATYIESDQDICNYRLICRATNWAVSSDNLSFWRKRFEAEFDVDKTHARRSNEQLMQLYQRRKWLLREGASFRKGHHPSELECLKVLRDLINESCIGSKNVDNDPEYVSVNQEHLTRFVRNHDVLRKILRRDSRSKRAPAPLLQAIQLCLYHHSIDLHVTFDTYSFDVSQKASYESVIKSPIFGGPNNTDVNFEWVSHVANFFKAHLTRPEHSLHQFWTALADELKPTYWRSPISPSTPQRIGQLFQGTYSYLDRPEMSRIRESSPGTELFMDRLSTDHQDGSFQTMEVTYPDLSKGEPFLWPRLFEHHLKSQVIARPQPQPRTRAQHRSAGPSVPEMPIGKPIPFCGEGYDNEDFNCSGWIQGLPPQQGIPGWQRITMMKYFIDNGQLDLGALWAYEGVTTPGNQFVFGRWWAVSDGDREMYCGPFLLWNVDRACDSITKSGQAAAQSTTSD